MSVTVVTPIFKSIYGGTYINEKTDYRRQYRRQPRCVCVQRSSGNLSDYSFFPDGGSCGRMGYRRQNEYVGTKSQNRRNAVGRRRGGRSSRFSYRGRVDHYLHRIAGLTFNDSEHVQNLGRIIAFGFPRFGKSARRSLS